MTTLQISTLKTMTYSEAESARAFAVVERLASLACAALVLTWPVASACRTRAFGKFGPGRKALRSAPSIKSTPFPSTSVTLQENPDATTRA